MKKVIPLIVIVILIVGVFGLFSQRETTQGRIIDIVTNEPIINIDVILDGKIVKTNEDGYFTLKSFNKIQDIVIDIPKEYEDVELINISNDLSVIKLLPTIEESSNRVEFALKQKDLNTIWLYLHPDDKIAWEKEEYFRKLENNPSTTAKKIELSIEELEEWKNPFRNKTYQNIMRAWPEEVRDDLFWKSLLSMYWQKTDGYWHFFTGFLSSKEEEKILMDAEESKLIIEEALKRISKSIGGAVAWSGKIISISENDGSTLVFLSEIPSYNNFVALFDGTTEVLKGDSVFIYGLMKDFTSYESQAGWNIFVPVIKALKIEEL